MRVVFIHDFQGVNTAERFFEAGAVAEFEDEVARRLVAEGAVEQAPEPEPEQEAQPSDEESGGDEQKPAAKATAKPAKGKGKQAEAES
jgi:hypothetical protein